MCYGSQRQKDRSPQCIRPDTEVSTGTHQVKQPMEGLILAEAASGKLQSEAEDGERNLTPSQGTGIPQPGCLCDAPTSLSIREAVG